MIKSTTIIGTATLFVLMSGLLFGFGILFGGLYIASLLFIILGLTILGITFHITVLLSVVYALFGIRDEIKEMRW